MRFFGPAALAFALAAPVPAGQKRNRLYGYVETSTIRTDHTHPNPYTGANSPYANRHARARTRPSRSSLHR